MTLDQITTAPRHDDAFLKATYGSRAKFLACVRGCMKARSAEKYSKYARHTEKLGMEAMPASVWEANQRKAIASLRDLLRVNA